MRLSVVAGLLYAQALGLIALSHPWAAVAMSALALVALLVRMATEVGERSAAIEDAKDRADWLEVMERRIAAVEASVETQKRQQALSKLAG